MLFILCCFERSRKVLQIFLGFKRTPSPFAGYKNSGGRRAIGRKGDKEMWRQGNRTSNILLVICAWATVPHSTLQFSPSNFMTLNILRPSNFFFTLHPPPDFLDRAIFGPLNSYLKKKKQIENFGPINVTTEVFYGLFQK